MSEAEAQEAARRMVMRALAQYGSSLTNEARLAFARSLAPDGYVVIRDRTDPEGGIPGRQ